MYNFEIKHIIRCNPDLLVCFLNFIQKFVLKSIKDIKIINLNSSVKMLEIHQETNTISILRIFNFKNCEVKFTSYLGIPAHAAM